ncbi:MAG: hypothetical protein PHC60_08465, partial [Heliobacteriaceae bacterium]|nr:hypothetical protein [Heliobacteriaceae bacterium]
MRALKTGAGLFLLLGICLGLVPGAAAESSGLYTTYKNYYYDPPAMVGRQAEITTRLQANPPDQCYFVFADQLHYIPV